MSAEDNDIELLAGQVWMAPIDPVPLLSPEDRAWVREHAERLQVVERDVTLRESLAKFLKPQAEIVRHPIPPGMSENTHEAPHYSDLLPKKDHP